MNAILHFAMSHLTNKQKNMLETVCPYSLCLCLFLHLIRFVLLISHQHKRAPNVPSSIRPDYAFKSCLVKFTFESFGKVDVSQARNSAFRTVGIWIDND